MSLCLGMTALNALSVKFFCKLRYILKTLKKTFYTMTFKLQIDYFFFFWFRGSKTQIRRNYLFLFYTGATKLLTKMI